MLGATISAASSVYGSPVTPGQYSLTGVLANDLVSGSSVVGVNTGATSSSSHPVVGSYTQTGSGSLGGPDAGNYSFPNVTSAANYSITPAPLSYVANQYSVASGLPISGLNGGLTGFVGGDSANNSTTGTLNWITPATLNSSPGYYAVDGTGLSAQNYQFSQATGNATALTITAPKSSIQTNSFIGGVYSSLNNPNSVNPGGGNGVNGGTQVFNGPPTGAGGGAGGAGGGANGQLGNYNIPGVGGSGGIQVNLFGLNLPSDVLIP